MAALGSALLLLDVTVVYVALPVIAHDLRAGFGELQWVIDAFTIVLAATLLAAGVLGDRQGRRSVFVWGVVVFALGSALCAAAWSGLALDVSRGVQALGAAAIFACSLALLAQEFSGAARGVAFGVWGAVTGAAMAFGPLVGGLIIEGLDWRWIFLVNLPVCLLLVAISLARVPESRAPSPGRLDVGGAILFAAACLLLALALTRGNAAGWLSVQILALLTGALLAAIAFVVVELRVDEPMLALSLFRNRAFSATALVAFAQSVAIYPLLIFLAIYLQEGLGFSALGAGLRLLPMTLLILVVAPFSGRLTSRLALRVPLVYGLLALSAGLLLLRDIGPGDTWQTMLPGMIVGGIAIGLISPALAAAMVSVLPVEQSGMSSGVNNTFRQLGIAMGIAGLGAIFDARVNAHGAGLGGIVAGLDTVALVAAAVSFTAAVVAWPLLRGHRS